MFLSKNENVNSSEIIDRDLVQWKRYAFENGNFLQTPGTYATSVIRDCTFGKCTFCGYNGPELSFHNEYQKVWMNMKFNKNYRVKEIFDDSGVWYRVKMQKILQMKLLLESYIKRLLFWI